VDLDHERLPLHSDERVTYSKFISYCLCILIWRFWWGNGVLGPRLILFWCLMPKGEKIKAKAINGSATTWEILKIENRAFGLSKLFYCLFCQKLASCGEKCWLWEKGGVLKSLINFFWNTSLYVSTSEFDLEIGNWVWFAKTNQVVAKSDLYMPYMNQNHIEFSFALILHLF
jgi:hypothetical protein